MDEDEILTVPYEDDDLDGSSTIYRTYKMDFENKRIKGMTDGQDAVAQATFKALQTKRYAFLIYDDDYGCDIFNKIGKLNLTDEYLASDIPAMIEDCLLYLEGVVGVGECEFEITDRDSVSITFEAQTEFGDLDVEGVLSDGN